MDKSDLFDALVEYHIAHNLREESMPHIRNGRFHDPSGRKVVEGRYEVPYDGALILADGEHTIDSLVRERVISSVGIGRSVPVDNEHALFDCLSANDYRDGAFVYANGKMTKVSLVNNHSDYLSELGEGLYALVPENFVSHDGNVPVQDHLGTKTLVAMVAPQVYPYLDTFQIKRTSYTHLGMGKVTHFNQDGLVEEFFFDCADKGPFIEHSQSIVGVYRRYGKEEGRLVLREEGIVEMGRDGRLVYHNSAEMRSGVHNDMAVPVLGGVLSLGPSGIGQF